MDGHEYEYYIADLFKSLDVNNVNVTQASRDGGIDITGYIDTPEGKIKMGIECKNVKSVGRPIVQKFHSALDINMKYNGKKVGYIVSSGKFTDDAINYKNEVNKKDPNLQLYFVNSHKLANVVKKNEENDLDNNFSSNINLDNIIKIFSLVLYYTIFGSVFFEIFDEAQSMYNVWIVVNIFIGLFGAVFLVYPLNAARYGWSTTFINWLVYLFILFVLFSASLLLFGASLLISTLI